MENLNFDILHDTGKNLCFIGDSYINQQMHRYFSATQNSEILRYEEILLKGQEWIDQHQFIIIVGSVKFKKIVVAGLAPYNPDYFSIVAKNNHIGFDVKIGKGVYICDFNVILDDAVIGDHVIITTHSIVSHCVEIKDFSHCGSYSHLLFATLGKGCYLAARTSIVGMKTAPITVANYCNFIINSTVTKNIDKAGTFYGNRCIDNLSSLDKRIDSK